MINLGLKLEFILKGLPSPASTFDSPKLWIILIAALSACIGLEMYGRSCGFILVSDSLQFLSAAESFRTEGKFLSPDGSYYSYWPPLFPVVLAATSKPLVLLVWVNVVCKIIIGLTLVYFSSIFFRTFKMKALFISISMINVYIIMISVFVRSELLFMCLIFANAYFAFNLKRPYYFWWFLITGFLMCLQRNAGLFWISGICVWMIVEPESSFGRNFRRAALFFVVSTSGLWAWNFYNTFFLPAGFSFYKHSFFADLPYNIFLITKTFGQIIFPVKQDLLLVTCSVMGAGTLLFILRKEFNRSLSF